MIGHTAASVLFVGDKSSKHTKSQRGSVFKVPIVWPSQSTLHTFPMILFMDVFFCFFFYPYPTSITSLSQLFSLSFSSATCLHSTSFSCALSQQSLTAFTDGLWYSSHHFGAAATAAETGKQAVDTPLLLCQPFNLKRTLSKWIRSNCLIIIHSQLQCLGAAITNAFLFAGGHQLSTMFYYKMFLH